MRNIIYYVASSLDGYISGPDGDISGFVAGGSGVEQYLRDLEAFDTVIMGRNTYEFGFKYGLVPGTAAYPHMRNIVFSSTLHYETPGPGLEVYPLDEGLIRDLKAAPGTDIYLCGGGEFAGWLLDRQLIEVLKVKLNPLVLGRGIPLFGHSESAVQLGLEASQAFEHGLQIMTYRVLYR